jgi:glycosyltransferase involved in cell wall biosynthesis
MHITLFCPFIQGPTRGNITTIQRIATHLQKIGHRISLIALDSPDTQDQLQQLQTDPPDLLHGFHAYHAGPATRTAAQQMSVPYLITLTGSDLFDQQFRQHPDTLLALRDAAVITCFDARVAEVAAGQFPTIAHKLEIIPQGVEPFPGVVPRTTPEDAFIVLLPAALRPVKGIVWAMDELEPLAAAVPHLQLWIAGGVLDVAYAEEICSKAADLPWVHLLGEIPYHAMGSLYTAADIVLNSSLFEGGMANALLEAMAMACPVLARDIPGNRSLIRHGETGWLFKDGDELRALVYSLAHQPNQREHVGRVAQNRVTECFSPAQEATALATLYTKLLS